MSSLERLAPTEITDAPNASGPLRGRRYAEDRLHLLVRDPRHVLAIWEISQDLNERASTMAHAAGSPVRYQIRIERETRVGAPSEIARTVDLPDALRDELWYVELPEPGGRVRLHLGLDLSGRFAVLLTSRWASVPPGRPCGEVGKWPVDPESAAWLERRLAEQALEPTGIPPSSAARYLVPPGPPRP